MPNQYESKIVLHFTILGVFRKRQKPFEKFVCEIRDVYAAGRLQHQRFSRNIAARYTSIGVITQSKWKP